MRHVSTHLLALLLMTTPAVAQEVANDGADEALDRPEAHVREGIYDKPFMFSVGRTRLGGYADLQYRVEREEGFTTESTFLAKQVNLFVFAPIHERVRFVSELEIEDGGEEIVLELAQLDVDLHPMISFRLGMLLSPIGRFNVAHDSPANEFVDRPLVATRVIPTTLSEPGAGFFGGFAPWDGARVAYDIYLVNGFGEGVVTDFEPTSPLDSGTPNLVDNNLFPSMVGRLAFSPVSPFELAVSGHSGPYNRWVVEGLRLEERRDVTLLAVDTELRLDPVTVKGEAAHASVDLPEGELGRRGERFGGLYGEVVVTFGEGWMAALPRSNFGVGTRYGFVDHDLSLPGDHTHRGTFGLHFRPVETAIFKLDYQRELSVDRSGNPVNGAAILFGGAAYF